MSTYTDQELFDAIRAGIGQFTNVEPEDVNREDHLEDDLFIDLRRDLPRILAYIQQELGVIFESEAISDFLAEAEEDPEKAVVTELLALVKEEVEFN